MAKLSQFRRDIERVEAGDWIKVGFSADATFEIKTKGQTSRFLMHLGALQREATREANRSPKPGQVLCTPDTLPVPLANRCIGQAMAEDTFLDVRGLYGEGDRPVSAEEFRGFLLQPMEYAAFVMLAYGAVIQVGAEREDEKQDAVGNSATASAGA